MGATPQKPKITYRDYTGTISSPVKIATSNLFIDTGTVPVDYMVGAIFNEIGGQELINYTTLSTGMISLDGGIAIENILDVKERYRSLNLLPTPNLAKSLSNIGINLNSYLPELNIDMDTNATDGTHRLLTDPKIYFTPDNKNVIIEFDDTLDDSMAIEIQFMEFEFRSVDVL